MTELITMTTTTSKSLAAGFRAPGGSYFGAECNARTILTGGSGMKTVIGHRYGDPERGSGFRQPVMREPAP